MLWINLIALSLLVQAFGSSCAFAHLANDPPGASEYREVILTVDEDGSRKALFNQYPVDKQVDIYLFAMIHRAPADTIFREYLAADGFKKLPTILDRIESSDSANLRDILIGAIWLTNLECDCVAQDTTIMKRLEAAELKSEKGDKPEDAISKRNYRQILWELQRRSGAN